MAEPSPGQIITPGGNPNDPPKQPVQPVQEVSVNLSQPSSSTSPQPQNIAPSIPAATPTPPQPVAAPVPASPQPINNVPPPATSTPPVTPAVAPLPQLPQEPNAGFAPQFDIGDPAPVPPPEDSQLDVSDTISWTASEYIAHQKDSQWYLALIGATILLAVAVYFITHGDMVSIGVIVFAAVVFGVYAAKKPKEQRYSITPAGITIGSKTYGFDQLKTFSITDDGAFSSITFWPLKRFMPAISIYYAPDDEDTIVQVLSNYLPLDTEKKDVVDSFMRKIRF